MTPIRRVGVVGGGQMGAGIAEVCARADLDVLIRETDQAALAAARQRVTTSLDRAQRAGKVDEAARRRADAMIRYTCDLADFADRDLAIEAASEDEGTKLAIFAELDRVLAQDHAVLASNTSSIPIMKLGTATRRPERVVGLHFFNPVPVQRLVEVIPSLVTSDDTVAVTADFAESALRKTVIRSQDRAGFVVNALLVPYLLSAVRMLESGFASAEDIDQGMVLGCAHPLGPLRLSDLIGLDTVAAIAESMYAEFKEPLYALPPLLLRMVDAGLLGRKTARGFHTY
ncbi:3-hydroxybutyryl-CoA dehydrogenase [Yinghuangia sp. YIM S09857]|uniref:3-hydroxybutyryl-CoA dehydrogenase n=1 Tax=Yinghuangia sp. YIM S09857 TaxID=3436929 RepID=UPI003F5340AB